MNRPPQTNVEIVVDIMEHSHYGALVQAFVINALMEWSKRIAATDPAKLETGLVSGHAWVGVAKEINEKLEARYGQARTQG